MRSTLGTPDRRIRRLEGSYFYVYNALGLDLDFGKRGGKLKKIFFYREGSQGHAGASIRTDRNVEPGDSGSKVLSSYGKPDKQGGPVVLPNGQYSGQWFFYAEGIQFELAPDQKVSVISVCRPTKGAGKKPEPKKHKVTKNQVS